VQLHAKYFVLSHNFLANIILYFAHTVAAFA
jgi:hypothetical protein